MVIERGDLVWCDYGPAVSSAPAGRRPVLVVQANQYNRSQIRTVVVAVVTSKTRAAELPGNVFLPSSVSGLSRDSVINLSQLITIDRDELGDAVGQAPPYVMAEVRAGLRRILDL